MTKGNRFSGTERICYCFLKDREILLISIWGLVNFNKSGFSVDDGDDLRWKAAEQRRRAPAAEM